MPSRIEPVQFGTGMGFCASFVHYHQNGSDLIGRIGGEEFLMVFPGTSVDEAVAAVERIRCSLTGRRVAIGAEISIGYSFSSGVCGVELTDDINIALERADRALYTAKRAGRNRVVSRRQGHA